MLHALKSTLDPVRLKRLLSLLTLAGLLSLAILLSGCAAAALSASSMMGSPNASSLEIHSQTDVRLQQANFIVTRTNVVGESRGFSLFGILTMVPARVNTAMNRLYSQAEMQPGRAQTLANLIMEKNSTFFILFAIPRTSIRADVIEFVPPTAAVVSPGALPGVTPIGRNE